MFSRKEYVALSIGGLAFGTILVFAWLLFFNQSGESIVEVPQQVAQLAVEIDSPAPRAEPPASANEESGWSARTVTGIILIPVGAVCFYLAYRKWIGKNKKAASVVGATLTATTTTVSTIKKLIPSTNWLAIIVALLGLALLTMPYWWNGSFRNVNTNVIGIIILAGGILFLLGRNISGEKVANFAGTILVIVVGVIALGWLWRQMPQPTFVVAEDGETAFVSANEWYKKDIPFGVKSYEIKPTGRYFLKLNGKQVFTPSAQAHIGLPGVITDARQHGVDSVREIGLKAVDREGMMVKIIFHR